MTRCLPSARPSGTHCWPSPSGRWTWPRWRPGQRTPGACGTSPPQHRTDVGRNLPRPVTDARIAARAAEGQARRAANAVLADVYALVQHEIVWASEAELTWTAADRAMTAAQEADTPVALAGALTLGMVQRSAGDTNGALMLVREAAGR
jgi:hypothetical protein